jgi:sugar transferase EpsL
MFKRLFDIMVSCIIVVLTVPAVLAIALLVRWRLGSPVLLRQSRPGLHGRLFTLYKFRSMSDARDDVGGLLPDAQRLSGFGRVLRASSLDELPELWNVIKGDMSFVGPRPLLVEYLSLYSPEQARRHEVKPGITGWAQVNGRNRLSWPKRLEMDVWYVDHRSFLLDLKIILMTVWKVLRREGISPEGHVTMERFKGDE